MTCDILTLKCKLEHAGGSLWHVEVKTCKFCFSFRVIKCWVKSFAKIFWQGLRGLSLIQDRVGIYSGYLTSMRCISYGARQLGFKSNVTKNRADI